MAVFRPRVYAIIIAMSLLTSMVAPPLLKRLLAKTPAPPSDVPDDTDTPYLYAVEETGHQHPPRIERV